MAKTNSESICYLPVKMAIFGPDWSNSEEERHFRDGSIQTCTISRVRTQCAQVGYPARTNMHAESEFHELTEASRVLYPAVYVV